MLFTNMTENVFCDELNILNILKLLHIVVRYSYFTPSILMQLT